MKGSKTISTAYPFGKKSPERLVAFSGKPLQDITLSAIQKGEIKATDVRISPATLLLQADVAEAAGRKKLADNFRRASELCQLPDDKILHIYEALRPLRSSGVELESIATELEAHYDAPLCAKMIRNAAKAYEKCGFLATSEDDPSGSD